MCIVLMPLGDCVSQRGHTRRSSVLTFDDTVVTVIRCELVISVTENNMLMIDEAAA